MGIFNVFWLLFLIFIDHCSITPAISTRINKEDGDIGDIANSTHIPPPPPPPPPAEEVVRTRMTTLKPSIAVIVAILTSIFSITFLLLLYVKHCKRNIYADNSRSHTLSRGNSGIKRKVIESLPLFRFSSLRGQKDGLECAVCLNKFEAEEVLRLLPKCKHAFHVECVDTWLDAHSTCPLCRYRVDPEDILLVDYSNHSHGGDQVTPRDSVKGKEIANPRMSGRHSSAGERGNPLEIIVENQGANDSRARVSLDSWNSRRKTGDLSSKSSSRKDGQLPVVQGDKHRLEHRIVISGEEEEGRRRWSDVQAAEILYLRSEMILGGGEEGGSGRGVINERSVSEITGMSRYRRSNNGGKEERERREESVVKRWMDWISQSQQKTAVNSATSSSSSSIVV